MQSDHDLLRAVTDHNPHIIWTAAPGGELAYLSQRWNELTGMTLDEARDGGWKSTLHPDDVEGCVERFSRSIATGEDYYYEHRYWSVPKQEYRWYSNEARAIRGSDGVIQGWVGVAASIHDRKLIERTVEVERANLKAMFESTPEFFCIIKGRELRFTYCNPAHRAIFGGEDLTGRTVPEAQPELAASGFTALIHGVLDTGEPALVRESPAMIRDEERWFDLIYAPSRNEHGEVDGVLGLGMDVTDKVRTREDIRRALLLRDEFLSIASHELKTPLTSLRLQAHMVKRHLARDPDGALSPERLSRFVDQIDRSVGKLVHLIDDMLDISRIATGKLNFQFEPFDLRELASEVLSRMELDFQSARIQVALEPGTPAEGEWDRYRVDQILSNLLTNAMRYGNGAPVSIHIENLPCDRVRLSVRDHGPGIAPENLERIFHRFERATSYVSVSGLGLGLFICREIAGRHGGTIHAESELGKGACFILELPKRPPAQFQ